MRMPKFVVPAEPCVAGDWVKVAAPGKINIALEVGPREIDGYHNLATVFLAVDLFEEVTVTATDIPGVSVSISSASSAPGAMRETPLDEDNLAAKAALALSEGHLDESGIHISITKNVPIAGGMAGGSADAAATLVACDYLWRLGKTREQLEEIGATLGADVPFLLSGGIALGVGRGDQVSPILSRAQTNWVLVFSPLGLSTPSVFAKLDELRQEAGAEVSQPEVEPELLLALSRGEVEMISAYTTNGLEVAALELRPDLRETLDLAYSQGTLTSVVSGSGPTVAMLTYSEDQAHAVAIDLADQGYYAVAVSGPVPGATIVATS